MPRTRTLAPTLALALAGLLAAVSLFAGAAVANSARPPAQPTAVAVVDLLTVFDGLDEKRRLDTELQALQSDSQAKLDELVNEIKSIQANLQGESAIYKRGTPEYREAAGRLIELQAQAEGRRNYLSQAFSMRRANMLRDLYQKVEDAITRIAESEGYDVVMSNDSVFPLPEQTTDRQMEATIVSKSVLYAHETTDITQDVINLLNSEYAAP